MTKSGILKISFIGDLMCLKEQNEAISKKKGSHNKYDEIFQYVMPLFADSDYVIGNLETPIGSKGFSEEAICFNTPVEFLQAVKNVGINFVSTANNHCLDRGIEGLEDTIRNIDTVSLNHSGTYLSKEASEDIFLTVIKGVKIAIVCCTFGTNSEVNGVMLPDEDLWRVDLLKKQNKPARIRFNPNSEVGHKMIADNVSSAAIKNTANDAYLERVIDKIRRAKELADLIFVLPHVGGQYNPAPGNYTKYIIDRISQVKPSLIIAGHPHVPLRFEDINEVFVAYSLGNFTFTPEVGYYIPNCLAEYGLILHSYWDIETKNLEKLSFDIVKNVVGEDGISRIIPIVDLYNSLTSAIEKERLFVEVQAVASRALSALTVDPISKNLHIR